MIERDSKNTGLLIREYDFQSAFRGNIKIYKKDGMVIVKDYIYLADDAGNEYLSPVNVVEIPAAIWQEVSQVL